MKCQNLFISVSILIYIMQLICTCHDSWVRIINMLCSSVIWNYLYKALEINFELPASVTELIM